ncbi:hypothetical protein QN277_022384 [Acacia crassicarpa]|uniref:ADP-ribosyl cyclase/cyclic ADP-ribose hydrolase n=1 Tax=Acacia crassicarpa TaxID=499986 RepID=A0AAE1JEZ3_9FABA|nr:hypothetical protein QN277_022384 [Acacia crassicarpa]
MAGFATSSHVPREKYDVFISFRGSDIRHGFLSHLTKQLRQERIDVYVDERLERGDEISSALLEAIERSTIALVIFSKDYASSRWCLEELVKIMKCKEVNSQIVIPVFYNIDPSYVRHQEGTYADAFAQHEQKFEDDLLQIWRSVLKEAANLSGYHSSNITNESDLIDLIIKDMWNKLEDKSTLEPKRLMIGFEKNLTTIESFMKVNSQEVRVLGIWGKGGMGKTTLAQVVFDKFSRQFDSSYFASNVREESKKLGLTCLLEKILSVLLNDKNFTLKGRSNTQTRLRRARVLLVLDDVDTSRQLKYIIEENLSLGPSSKVIITSRDRHVLISGGVHVVHEVEELNEEESLQLFCWHAFKQAYPKVGYEKLSVQAIQYAGGLPLALQVLGSYLNSRDTKTWDSALKKFKKHPNVEVQTVLRVSFDGLDIPEKRIFLDIAFFFRGEKKEDTIRMLDACDDFYTDCGIDNLINKALITISRDNTVEIHDLLQEMAEDIVREESIGDPGKRSRLNDTKEIQDVLKNNKGTDAIEGITLEFEIPHLSAESFQEMSNLRFLKIQSPRLKIGYDFSKDPEVICYPNSYFLHGLNSLSNKLRYFYWELYPFKSLPLGFCPEKLVEIHLQTSEIKKLWNGVQDLMNLKIINLRYSMKLKELPDFSKACNLEIVDLTGCFDLRSIHPSILSLPKLVSLNLSECYKLKNLHGKNHLKSLKHLTLKDCERLKEFLLSSEEMRSLDLAATRIKTLNLPVGRFNKLEDLTLGRPLESFQINELSCLTSLKKFSLSYFRGVLEKSKLHILFDAWLSLEELRLTYCEVSEIPENISSLSLLKILSLRGCHIESLPHSIKHLSELKQIDLRECRWLRTLPELPSSITHFYVSECISLETMDFTLMRAISNNAGEVKVCYPGITIPKGFKDSQTGKNSITIELAPPSSSDHLLGFVCCCILSGNINFGPLSLDCVAISRKFHCEDDEINYKDEKEFPHLWRTQRDNVFVWYDPMEQTLKGTQRRRYDEGTTYKFACEFFITHCRHRGNDFDPFIKACGLCPIYASELQETVQQMELKLEMGTEIEMPESFNVFQRLRNLSWMPSFLRNA